MSYKNFKNRSSATVFSDFGDNFAFFGYNSPNNKFKTPLRN